jgi:hypothetical protein
MTKATRLLDWRPRARLSDMLPAIVADYLARYESRVAADRSALVAAGAPGLP